MKYKLIVDDENKAAKHDGRKRPKGTIHTIAEMDCPNGLPNCRNCGDPIYKEICKANGHCSLCGTAHGIGPDSGLAANGYTLEVAD